MSKPRPVDDPRLQRLLNALPHSARRTFTWLIRPEAKFLRIPLGIALIVGGTFSFLPVLGLWMLPVGALLLGEDIPLLRRVSLRALGQAQKWWDVWSDRRQSPPGRG